MRKFDWDSVPARKFLEHWSFLIMLCITVLISGLIIPRLIGRSEEARTTKAIVQMNEISKALKLYKKDNGRYPTTDQGLRALMERPILKPVPQNWKPYFDKIPKDPWGNEYVYRAPGFGERYSLRCDGHEELRSNEAIKEKELFKAREAFHKGDLSKIKELIEENPEIIKVKDDETGETLLHLAASGYDEEALKLLIDLGADVNIKDSNGCTPLFYTAKGSTIKKAELLIENGANVNARAVDCLAPLHTAALYCPSPVN
ncbi:MAG: type II secretion system major pseudopilin GspG [Candidatus Eremiobacteraeota bacterium]|nr:type II secretion system major pseudopilin GspG [Candidatus Eremiobacteraeota bacterium]